MRLRTSREYQAVYASGLRRQSRYFVFFALRQPENTAGPSRFGITIPRKVGTAVERNRIRRRTREALRHERALLAHGWDVVLNPRRSALESVFAELQADVAGALAYFRDLPARAAQVPR